LIAHEIRALKASIVLMAKSFFADPQWIIPSLTFPFAFSFVALVMFANTENSPLLSAVLGGGFMGMWGTTVYGSANSIAFDRWNGTIEAVLATPVRLFYVVLGRVFWNTFIGIINGFLILAVGFVWFGMSVTIANPLLFILATVMTYLSLSSFGMLLCSIYVLTRKALFIGSSLEMAVYVATGTMFPIGLLPFFAQPISLALPPTWGIEAIRKSAIPGYLGIAMGYWVDILLITLETALFFAFCIVLYSKLESIAKANGTLEQY
jgi:ABC-2 type transport system permease protein